MSKMIIEKKIKANNENIKAIKNGIIEVSNKITDINSIQAEIDKIKNEIKEIKKPDDKQLKEIYRQFNENLDLYDQEGNDKQREKHMMTPYHSVGFEELKNELFIDAIKLHKMIVDGNPTVFKNLFYAVDNVLKNSIILKEPKEFDEFFKRVWQGFFMFMPVVSTTFHSFGKLFKNFGQNDIGWLIIDESGQAPPQYSVGAIYKSSNVIVVGDPLQTQPISIIGKKLIDELFAKFGLQKEYWSPLYTSVQNIADRNSLYRTEYENYMIGFPLLVHRRCNDPMFTICNELSYNGRMVHATYKKDHDGIIQILGKSRWINIVDDNPRKKISIDEYAKLKEMLVILIDKKGFEFLDNVYVITLFKDFAEYIKNNLLNDINSSIKQTNCDDCFLKNWKRSNVGTVHSFQGKENDIVFFLLGAQGREKDIKEQDYSAKDYQNYANLLLNKENVLNVAISRAKVATYIIGNEEGLKRKFENIRIVHTYISNHK